MKPNRLIYLPLGGAGEIGMNAYVYGYGPVGKERLILVDIGVTFPDMDTTPGVDLIVPDLNWLLERKDRLEAIFITHAHEDHIGALAAYWGDLGVPVYARRFTATIGRGKFEEAGHPPEAIQIVEPRPETIEAGPFSVQFVPISHSIPESSALIIDSPAGRVLHSGDFKLDPAPLVGEPWQPELYAEIARERAVKVLMCDSTNVFTLHPGRSEETLQEPLRELIAGQRGMVVATTFASNVARVRTLAEAAVAAGRQVCLLGRAMRRMVTAAEQAGVLEHFPRVIAPEDAIELPRKDVMLIVTGSQGERRAATAQLSRGRYLGIELTDGDTFLFSSRTIPGNERGVISIMNAFSEKGVNVVDDHGGLYHVSGHANRPDLETVHNILQPAIVIPMHGEHRHLREHARIALAAGRQSMVVTNGMMIDLTGDAPVLAEQMTQGRCYLDGSVMIGGRDGIVRDRIRMALNGHAMVTLILDENDESLGEPWVEVMGLPPKGRGGVELSEALEVALAALVERLPRKVLRDDAKLEEELRRTTRQVSLDEIGKKPEVTVVISRLVEDQ